MNDHHAHWQASSESPHQPNLHIQRPWLSWSDDAKKKSMACGTFSFTSLACCAFFFIKKLACGACFPLKNLLLDHSVIWSFLFCHAIHWWWEWVLKRVWEKRFCSHNFSHSAWLWQWGANNLDKTESPSKVCMCGVSTQQWPSTQITLFERTRQSAWLDAVKIPLTRSERILVY